MLIWVITLFCFLGTLPRIKGETYLLDMLGRCAVNVLPTIDRNMGFWSEILQWRMLGKGSIETLGRQIMQEPHNLMKRAHGPEVDA